MAENRFKTRLANTLNNYLKNNSRYFKQVNQNGLMVNLAENPKWEAFASTGIRRKEALVRNSISHGMIRQDEERGDWFTAAASSYQQQLYSQLDASKANRIYEYRMMAQYPDVNNALDEITNMFINTDENGDCIYFNYDDSKLPIAEENLLRDEWKEYIAIYDFQNKGKKYCEDLLVDGELFLEYIVNDDREENLQKGILGVLQLPAELMDVLYKDRYNELVGMFIGRDVTVDNVNAPSQVITMEQRPYEPHQVFYVSSGTWDASGQYIVPFIERGRRRYIQLSFLEDAIIIYRLVRAPERLIFKADVGNMPAPEAEAYLKRLQQSFFKQKAFDMNTGDITQKFDAQTMLDAFWIATGQGNNGVDITQLTGGANLGQLDDLKYFQQALYRAFYVPVSRLKEDAQQGIDGSTILQEELKLAEKVIAIQRRFVPAIKDGFITHLKLKKLWDELGLNEKYIQINFVPPSNYFRQRELQTAQLEATAFGALASVEQISKSYLMKRILKMSDAQVASQYELRKKEARIEYEIGQIQNNGPNWKVATLAQAAGGGEGGDGMGGGDDFGGGGFDDFGGGDMGMDMDGGDMDMGEVADTMDENPGGDEAL